jgi:hypothetical protein
MQWGWGRRADGVPRKIFPRYQLIVVLAGLTLAGCNTNQTASLSGTRGASVAFESIDGPPPELFKKLVQGLNSEAQARQLAILSREDAPAYRVRGYLGAQTKAGKSTVTWLWDVYDAQQQRVQRFSGAEIVAGKGRDAWAAVDEAALERIARNSVAELGAFLTSNAAIPAATAGFADQSSPEAAGIVRVSQPEEAPDAPSDAVPLPRKRAKTSVSAAETLTLAAQRHQ